jgi:hypothetical protein
MTPAEAFKLEDKELKTNKLEIEGTPLGTNHLKAAEYIAAMKRPETPGICLATSIM